MTDEKELIKKRGSIKGRLTAFSTYLTSLKVSSLGSQESKELQLRIGKIESLYDQYDEVQTQLECSTDNMDVQLTERTDFEKQYYKLLANAQLIIETVKKAEDKIEIGSCSRNPKLVKLPTIQLPKFGGTYETWLEFHDTFSSLIHNNEDIDEINKFHYLRASLQGSAAVVIQSIEFSATNYSVAWKLLCERFDNKRVLIQNHVAALFNIDTVTKESSIALKRMIDQVNKNLRSLESLGEPVANWDTLLIYIVTRKLDPKTYREWEEHKGELDTNKKSISLNSFLEFIRNRADLLETIEMSHTYTNTSNKNNNCSNASKIKAMVAVQNVTNKSNTLPMKPCPNCNDEHYLNNCPNFLALNSEQRYKLLPNYKICFNCFRGGHYANTCKKPGCKVCKRKHHTLLHINEFSVKQVANSSAHVDSVNSNNTNKDTVNNNCQNSSVTLTSNVTSYEGMGQCDVLLSTALVKVYDCNNREIIARAILDSGSTSCLLTERMYEKLNVSTNQVDRSVVGINNVTSHISKMCRIPIKSLNEEFSCFISCYILPSITGSVPACHIDVQNLNIPSNICLADPNYYAPADVDLILGADIFWDILCSQNIKLGEGRPILYETRLGWIVSGPVSGGCVSTLPHKIKCNFTQIDSGISHCAEDDIQTQLMRFWQLEEVGPPSSQYFPEEKLCEDHFIKNTTRLADGRFCVRIPLKQSPEVLGDSYHRAKKCLLSLERRLKGNESSFSIMYKDFMTEYETLGHMSECSVGNSVPTYFIPHHGVLRDSSTTTKLRVVFNASSPTTTGVSLNNIQMVGPTIQDDLLSILLRFRQHKYVIAADVEKMYRQIVVHADDRPLQQIVWRNKDTDPLKIFMLNRITYGMASAPYLATRCLKQIGLDCKDPKISEVIIHDFYVDDLLTGGDDIDEVLHIRERVTAELASACLPLRKWKSNDSKLLLEPNQSSLDLNIGVTEPSKTLGLGWHPMSDHLYFTIGPASAKETTKRDLLSVIAQIFDPLGLLAPCVILMKILLQKLWLLRLSWDDKLPPEINRVWVDMVQSLPDLNNVRIPRRIICDSPSQLEIHIFSDASERAYGACIYIRSINDKGEVSVNLLIAKSRVASIKPVTIPRLELMGALIGSRLYERVVNALRAPIRHSVFWTDSTIVLGWLKMLPSKLQPFVRNRIAEILETTHNCTWRHVPTDENPADLLSRGISVNSLQVNDLWWQGPEFLKYDESRWPLTPSAVEKLPETRSEVSLFCSSDNTPHEVIDFNRFSSISRLQRTTAYVLRFANILKKENRPYPSYLTTDELNKALRLIIRMSQMQSFAEYNLLMKNQKLPHKSPLVKFNVYLDEDRIMRIGGRLNNSNFNYDKKHPIILQSTNQFTKLLFLFEHNRLMHAGPQLLLATIRETYWPIGGRNLAKNCYRNCVRCSRLKGKVLAPLMGQLPQQRLTSGGYPFESVGVDYAGPVSCANRAGRGCRITKSYIAVFICFTTKAIHLELVSDLTSNNYLLALRRFISRRGKPNHVFSDNGTSFVGAYNDLSKFLKTNCNSLAATAAQENINFHFIPAYSPHFGGLWEAGVKSTKYHLIRVLGHCNLTFEELNTTLVQIEAILNSRPLSPLSSDSEDLTPLTPGHFLVGRPLTALPEKNHQDLPLNRLTRFQRIEQIRQHYWTRWNKEYIAELQQRVKWRSDEYSLQPNRMVIIKEDNTPPLKWKLGRIIAVHPGADGINRVADIRTATGIVKRSFSKICPLPEHV